MRTYLEMRNANRSLTLNYTRKFHSFAGYLELKSLMPS